jgi:glucose-1-phosphate cytidylyltransferase
MKVVILCGGLGTRLREETEFRPKPMVNIGERPILWHIMKAYAHYGHREFILSTGYKGDLIKEYFYHYELMNSDVTLELGRPDKMRFHRQSPEEPWTVTLADTGVDTLKGARLKRVEQYVPDDEFMVTYGDGVSDIDINKLIAFHRQHGMLATVTGISPASRFGELKIQGDRVESFTEKPEVGSGLINGGFFIFKKEIFDYVSADKTCDLEVGTLETLAKMGQLMVYRHDGFWACMDTIRDMEYLNRLWEDGQASWRVWP